VIAHVSGLPVEEALPALLSVAASVLVQLQWRRRGPTPTSSLTSPDLSETRFKGPRYGRSSVYATSWRGS
jgi:hypothetical protein